jgi:3-hydroxyisobutyrate dehydrogenase-like beta-hydroxyacid dehydrogenase
MTTVTVVGLGPMGQALSGALLDANYRTTVWNRTAAKAEDLRSRGAVVAVSPAAAVAASDLTLINVVDHGAITTPTATIGTPSASILFAGPRDDFDTHRALFTAMGGPTWLGDDHGRAAAYDMSLLDLFLTSVSGFLHAMTVARANGIVTRELLPHAQGIVGILPEILTELTERVEADNHDDSSAPVASVAASLRHLIAASRDAGVEYRCVGILPRAGRRRSGRRVRAGRDQPRRRGGR